MNDFSQEEYEYMKGLAEKNGLCFNCFHTLACCDGLCRHLDDEPNGHICSDHH